MLSVLKNVIHTYLKQCLQLFNSEIDSIVQSQISRVIFHWLYFQDSTQQSNSINWFWKQRSCFY